MTLDLNVSGNDVEIEAEIRNVVKEQQGGTDDYVRLKNLPSLNGKTIIGNMEEEDPTVPAWAKGDRKPLYTSEEVGAFGEDDVMSLEEIKTMIDSVFGTGGKG